MTVEELMRDLDFDNTPVIIFDKLYSSFDEGCRVRNLSRYQLCRAIADKSIKHTKLLTKKEAKYVS